MISACSAMAGAFAITSDKAKSMGNPFKAPQRRKALVFWLAVWLVLGLAVGLRLGLAVGLMDRLAAAAVTSRRYVVFLLCSRRHLPFRLGLFLDWAVTAGLMRYSGPAYQYRHRELQHWLRQHPPDLP